MAARGENFDCEDVARPRGETSNSLLEILVGWNVHLEPHSRSCNKPEYVVSNFGQAPPLFPREPREADL